MTPDLSRSIAEKLRVFRHTTGRTDTASALELEREFSMFINEHYDQVNSVQDIPAKFDPIVRAAA